MMRGVLALICRRRARPTARSTMGTSTSLRSAPDHRIAAIVPAIDPGVRTLASSIQANGVAPDAVGLPAVKPGRGLLLGGELLGPLPLPFPLPCACTGDEKASTSTALAMTDATYRPPSIRGEASSLSCPRQLPVSRRRRP